MKTKNPSSDKGIYSHELITYNEDDAQVNSEEVQVLIKTEKRHFKKGEFFLMTYKLDDLVMEKKYNVTELRTLIALRRRLDFNNRIKGFRQSDLAKEIGTGQPNVSKALKTLERDCIIRKEGVDYYFSDTYIKGAGD
jgi:DNA-binding MarR family transcriptional regulator